MAIGLKLKTVGDFVSKNWEKLPEIVSVGKDTVDIIKGKKTLETVRHFTDAATQAGQAAKDTASNVGTIKTAIVAVAVIIGVIVLFFVLKKAR